MEVRKAHDCERFADEEDRRGKGNCEMVCAKVTMRLLNDQRSKMNTLSYKRCR